ncbi:MAG: flavin reductase [Gammaproteobacteria bacterium]|nr:flavin reductase [Gammaproteobacteria bacterium]
MKKEIKIKPFWYSDIWLFPKIITIITTLDEQGRVNAAPYSHIMQYDVMPKNPRMIVGFRQSSHTFENILATGEFVVNCPRAEHLADMMETARFWPEGVNELEHTSFTPIPSRKVKPPSLEECPQIAECTVDQIIRLDKSSGIVIGKIEALVFDEELADMDREERINAMDLPIGLGDQNRKYYYHAKLQPDNVVMHELQEPPDAMRGMDTKTTMEWAPDAMKMLMTIPPGVRKMVTQSTEDWVREKGEDVVTMELFNALAEEQGMSADFFDRFRDERKKNSA